MLGFVVNPHCSLAACGTLDRDRAMQIVKNIIIIISLIMNVIIMIVVIIIIITMVRFWPI